MDLKGFEKLDSSIIFYAISVFFVVLTLGYFGFEYIEHLSPFTVSAILSGVFLSALLLGVSREFIGSKMLAYMISGGSYIVFYLYTSARFIQTSNQILASLVVSALVFSGLGYLITNYREKLPNKEQSHKIIAVLAALLLVIITYNITMVSYDFDLTVQDELEVVEGSNSFAEASIVKVGYLPIDINRERATVCFGTNESNERLGSDSVGGDMTGFGPESTTHQLNVTLNERNLENIDNLNEGETYPVERTEDCFNDNLEEGVIGVDAAEAYSYPY